MFPVKQCLIAAEKRLNDDIAAKQAIDALTQAQGCIDEGNALLVQSAQVISDTTEENVAQSTEYTTAAKAQFEEARSHIEDAQNYYSSANFDDLLAYLDLKSQAAGEALASNAAILIQDKQRQSLITMPITKLMLKLLRWQKNFLLISRN